MKTLRFLAFGLLTMMAVMQPFRGMSQYGVPATPVAEVVTPEIQALARGLQNDPVKIFNYVHDHIRHVLYFGSKKGAEMTLLEKSGNDFDQCALLVALLRAAGYSPNYEFGVLEMPYDATDGTHNDLHHWLQLTLVNTNWSNTLDYFGSLLGQRGYPNYAYFIYDDNNTIGFQRVWVILTIGGTTYHLDPAFKVSEPVTGISLTNTIGFSTSGLLSAAGGTDTGNYVTNLNEANIRATLTGYTTNLLNYLQSNAPNASVQQVLGGWQIIATTNTVLSQSLLFPEDSDDLPVEDWSNESTNLMTSFSIAFAGTNYQWWMPQLEGQRISLTYSNNGVARLWQDDSLLVQKSTAVTDTNFVLTINHPFGYWDYTTNGLIDTGLDDQATTNFCQRTSSTYVMVYAFEPDWSWLHKRQNQLDAYRMSGLTNGSRQVVSETLNILGLSWVLETADVNQILASQMGMLSQNHHTIGRVGQESAGFFIDIHKTSGDFPSSGIDDAVSQDNSIREPDLTAYFSSALESGIIEQLQPTNTAASTVKMLEIANTNHQAVFLASITNWATGANIQNQLVGYDTATKNLLTAYVNAGSYLLLPKSGTNRVAGTGSWAGYGLVARYFNSTNLTESLSMLITGGYNGGYSGGDSGIDPDAVDIFDDSYWDFFLSTPPWTPAPTGADPVDMPDGTFQVEHTDLAVGQAEPRGITLTRYYNSARRNSNPAGMAGGWLHNYNINATTVAAPWPALGGMSPQHMASMIVAAYAGANIYNSTPNAKNWMVTALVAKWGIDQLKNNGVAVAMGKDIVEFIKQPNGIFNPPGNCTMTLTQANSAYSLQERHGNTFRFDSLGRLTNIVDQYSQSVTVTYNTSNWVNTITDWKKNRTLTFTYTGSQLTSVSDNSTPSRTIRYAYSAANAQGDLTTFTDAEGKATTYTYDTNHQITATLDALSRLVVSNLYDSQGHITTQYTQGDTNKAWQIFWSGWQTVEQDPAGNQRIFFYDDQSRLVGLQDQLQHLTQTLYDGQNHLSMVVSPLNETNQYVYDSNNNLIYSIDPLGFTNQFVYDNQNNLVKTIDPRSNSTTFGYNTNFSLTGQTNGAGDFVNYTYNGDGTLHTRTDAGGTTTYDTYDSYGQLTHITYPNSLGSESFVNNLRGDSTSHTDANGNATTFAYNNRRELTNTIAPTNLTVKVSFDAADNVANITDARGNTATRAWSATRHLLATTMPSTPQGTPVVTNSYDSRDWLIRMIDPLQNPVLYTNDVAGRLISVTDPAQRTTTFSYDADGRKLARVKAANETNSQTWDARGSMLKLTDGAGHFSTRAYDAAGNQIILTNRNGKKWQFQFDGANRLTNTITPLGRSTSLIFNHQGLVASLKDPAGQTTSLGYDAKGRLTNRTDNIATTLLSYDANDNRTSVIESSKTNAWTYDAYNRISTYRDTAGNLIQYRYDANGNVTNLMYPGNRAVTYFYDSLNRLTNVMDWSGRKTSFAYDLNNRVTSIIRPNGTFRTINYDAAGQTTNVLEQTAVGFPIALFRLNWNNAAEAQWEFAAPLPHTNTPPTRTMTYDDDNRLATFNGLSVTSDLDGNLTSAPLTNSTFVTYTYDARNRLSDGGGVTNAYDAMNNRIGQTYGTNAATFVINPNTRLPQVLMRIKNGVTNYYIYGLGLLYQITETTTATNTLTYHYDYRGSTIALSADNGLVTDRIEYSLYGSTTYRAGTNDTPFLFNGRYGVQTDPNGLLNMRARYYNPYLCRFLNPDPTGFSGGMNFYAYANGNPVSLFDPFGLGATEPTGNSWLGDMLRNVPIIGGLLGGVGDVLSGLGNTALGLGTFGQSGTLGNGLNQIGYGLGHTVEGAFTTAGYAWNVPNSAIGLLIGLAGLPFGGDLPTIGHNGIQFANNPLMFRNGDITFGNVMNFGAPYTYPNGDVDYMGPNDSLPGDASPWTYGEHEEQHTYQGMILGPLYLPAYGIGMVGALLQGQTGLGVIGPANFMETGPYYPETQQRPPQPWP